MFTGHMIRMVLTRLRALTLGLHHGNSHRRIISITKHPNVYQPTPTAGQRLFWWAEKTGFTLWGAGCSSNSFAIISLIAAMLGATAPNKQQPQQQQQQIRIYWTGCNPVSAAAAHTTFMDYIISTLWSHFILEAALGLCLLSTEEHAKKQETVCTQPGSHDPP